MKRLLCTLLLGIMITNTSFAATLNPDHHLSPVTLSNASKNITAMLGGSLPYAPIPITVKPGDPQKTFHMSYDDYLQMLLSEGGSASKKSSVQEFILRVTPNTNTTPSLAVAFSTQDNITMKPNKFIIACHQKLTNCPLHIQIGSDNNIRFYDDFGTLLSVAQIRKSH